MDDSGSEFRSRHFDLPTQQRRLRHLRSVALRNIASSSGRDSSENASQLQTHFSLHDIKSHNVFYESEKIKGSSNPTWKSFCLGKFGSETVRTAAFVFLVRVWRGNEDSCKLIIEWKVDLFGLKFLGRQLQKEGSYPLNSLIFGLSDGYYGAPDGKDLPSAFGDITKAVMKVEQSDVRESYSINSLLRIQTVLRAIQQTQNSVQRVRSSIEDQLSKSQAFASMKKNREMLTLHVTQMRSELEWRTMQLQGDKELLEQLRAKNHQRDVARNNKLDTLRKDKNRLHDKKKGYFDVREDLIKTGAALVMRRKQLISELAHIYPINELTSGEYTVCGVRLPNSEDFNGRDDLMIAIALGYTCHLVQMVSQFLDVPLRYTTDHRGSKSLITDHILDKLAEKDRGFPLYRQGKEKFQFNYGVYLLNKNIAQLRYYCGLGTTDLRLTLPNLKSLLELRLGVKFDTTHVLAGHHIAIPPNLGGPQKYNFSFQPQHHTGKVDALLASADEVLDNGTMKKWCNEQTLQKQMFAQGTDNHSVDESSRILIVPRAKKCIDGEDVFKSSPDSFFENDDRLAEKVLEMVASSADKRATDGVITTKESDNSQFFVSGSSLSDPVPLKHKMVDATKEDVEESGGEECYKPWHPSVGQGLHKSDSNALLEEIPIAKAKTLICDDASSDPCTFKTSAMHQRKFSNGSLDDALSDNCAKGAATFSGVKDTVLAPQNGAAS